MDAEFTCPQCGEQDDHGGVCTCGAQMEATCPHDRAISDCSECSDDFGDEDMNWDD